MAVLTTRELRAVNRGKIREKYEVGNRIQNLDTDGSFSGGITDASFTATNQDKITLANNQTDGKFAISVNTTGTNHTVTLYAPVTSQAVALTLPDIATDTLVSRTSTDTLTNKTLTTPTITVPTIADFTSATHDHSNAAGGGALSASVAQTGTTSNTFAVDSDNTSGVLQLKTTTGGTDHTVVLTNATTTAARTITLPDATDTLVGKATTDSLTNKTLASAALSGTLTITTPTVTGTWTDLGAVTTVDINGGTVDGATVGAASASTGAFTTLAASGATTLSGDVAVAANKDISLTAGTGYIQVNGASSGGIKIIGTATGTSVTTLTNSNAAGARTVTLPDATCTLIGGASSNTFTAAQNVTRDDTTDGLVDALVLTHSSSDDNATEGDGVSIGFNLENATGTSTVEEWARIDALSTTITNGSEDGDIVLSTMMGGTVTPAVTVDASAQELVIGQDATDANGMHALRIWPLTAAKGSIVIQPTDNTGDDTVTITNTNTSGDITLTLPSATATLSGIGLAETFSAVKTFTAAPIIHYSGTDTNAVRDLLTIKNESSGTPAAGLGIGVSFQITDLTGATVEEQASMDVKLATATSTAEDVDIVFSQNLAGTITPTVTFDSINQEVVIGQDSTDANGMHGLRIWPLTAARGSLLFQPTDNTGDDTITITNGNTSGDITVTLPTVTSTLAILGANTFTATQTIQALTAGAGAYAMDFSASAGAFTTSSGTNTLSGNVAISGSKTFTTGSGAVSLAGPVTISGTNTFTTGTGNITLKGDVSIDGGKDFDMSAGAGTFATGTGTSTIGGDLEVASDIDTSGASALVIGGDAATSLTIGAVDVVSTLQSSALVLDSTAAATLQIGAVDILQYDDAAISAFAGAANTAGQDFYAETEDGGAATSGNAGAAGGALSIKTGDGSQGFSTENENGAAGGAITITSGTGGNAGLVASGTADGATGGAISITAGDGGGGGDASGTDGDGGAVSIDSGAAGSGGSSGGSAGAITVGATNATAIAVGNTAATTTVNGVVKGEAEGYMTHTLVVDVTVSEINAGHVLVTVPAGRQFQLVDLKQIAYGGTVGGAASIEVEGSADLTSTTAATLAQSVVVQMDTAGVTVLTDGASFTAQTAGTDISVTKTGGDATTATGVRFIISYMLV